MAADILLYQVVFYPCNIIRAYLNFFYPFSNYFVVVQLVLVEDLIASFSSYMCTEFTLNVDDHYPEYERFL